MSTCVATIRWHLLTYAGCIFSAELTTDNGNLDAIAANRWDSREQLVTP